MGSLISETIGKKYGVPVKAKIIDDTPDIASIKVESPNNLKSDFQGPVGGAAAGRSCLQTAIANVKTAESAPVLFTERRGSLLDVRIQTIPTQASQETLERVLGDARKNPAIAATATKRAVQYAWSVSAFKHVDTVSKADAATKM